MGGTHMEVSFELGLLVSELSEEPWRGKLITFSENPELQLVVGDDLRSKTNFIRRMRWGYNTDFQIVFDLILKVAVEGRLKPEQMIKRVFVFSDMEFDQASSSHYSVRETNTKGVALVSGFSKNLIKIFLDNDGEIDPMAIMEAVISKAEYSMLVVID